MQSNKAALVGLASGLTTALLSVAASFDWSVFGPKTGAIATGLVGLAAAVASAYLHPAPGQGSGPAAPHA